MGFSLVCMFCNKSQINLFKSKKAFSITIRWLPFTIRSKIPHFLNLIAVKIFFIGQKHVRFNWHNITAIGKTYRKHKKIVTDSRAYGTDEMANPRFPKTEDFALFLI